MTQLRPRQDRASFQIKPVKFGESVFGAPLWYFPAQQANPNRGLVLAGTHGDETASVTLLSCALRSIEASTLQHDLILSLNPDGNQLGTRTNANIVDLNRAFPSKNWTSEGTVYRWSCAEVRDVAVKTGDLDALEPEVEALLELIAERQPKFVVSFHEPLACVDELQASPLGRWLESKFELPLVSDVGYETPGSFGSWCQEQALPCVTMELPAIAPDHAVERYLDAMVELLQTGQDLTR